MTTSSSSCCPIAGLAQKVLQWWARDRTTLSNRVRECSSRAADTYSSSPSLLMVESAVRNRVKCRAKRCESRHARYSRGEPPHNLLKARRAARRAPFGKLRSPTASQSAAKKAGGNRLSDEVRAPPAEAQHRREAAKKAEASSALWFLLSLAERGRSTSGAATKGTHHGHGSTLCTV